MSRLVIKQLLESALMAMTPSLPTQFENVDFVPPSTGAYQSVNLVLGEPDNRVYSNTFYEESGYLQVLLRYPAGEGEKEPILRAELLREVFPRGRTLTQGGVTVTLWRTAAIHQGFSSDNRWCIPVRIWFHAQVYL